MNTMMANTTTAPNKTEEKQKQKKQKGFPDRDPNPKVNPKTKA
jgi:hypothetical protein